MTQQPEPFRGCHETSDSDRNTRIKHPELFVEQVLRLVRHVQFRRGKRTVGELLRFVEQAFCRHCVQNMDRAARFLEILIFTVNLCASIAAQAYRPPMA